jgi:hypothetical protein
MRIIRENQNSRQMSTIHEFLAEIKKPHYAVRLIEYGVPETIVLGNGRPKYYWLDTTNTLIVP